MPPRISRRGMATAPVRIGRRYFGIQTTWKAVWNTPFAVACTFSTGTVYHTRALSQGRAPPPRTEVRGFRRGHRSTRGNPAVAWNDAVLRHPGITGQWPGARTAEARSSTSSSRGAGDDADRGFPRARGDRGAGEDDDPHGGRLGGPSVSPARAPPAGGLRPAG